MEKKSEYFSWQFGDSDMEPAFLIVPGNNGLRIIQIDPCLVSIGLEHRVVYETQNHDVNTLSLHQPDKLLA